MRRGKVKAVVRTLAAIALLSMVATAPAVAGPNRCGTKPPDRSPTWTDGLGKHWFDSHGVWTQGPDGFIWGYGGVDFDSRSVQVNPTTDHSYQLYLSPSEQCATVSGDGNAPNVGEYPVQPAPAIVSMPWLHRDGKVFRADDGRTTILRGVDYPYNQEFLSPPADLTDADMARIASWGMNLLRIRLDPLRDGYYSGHAPEPGYWENLDQIVAMANRHGLYVLLSLGGGGALPDQQAYDKAKFIQGSSEWNWWMNAETTMFRRYANWPGVVGFDTINEDDSYPPFVHDRMFMGPAHRAIDAALRQAVGDNRHVYFQEPSGWSYWGAEYWPGMMQGNDIGDPNRFYCPKWKPGGNGGSDLDQESQLAAQSNASMFMCEMWVDNSNESTVEAWQRDGQSAMDARLIGGVRTTYPYADGYGMLNYPANTEVPWIKELARPYPEWAGGAIQSIHYDYDARRLVVQFALDGSGPSEVFVGHTGTYSNGFTATTSTGGSLIVDGSGAVVQAEGMSWDASTQRVVLPAQTGTVTFTLAPR